MRNRFEWGLITDVQPPDLETRIAILRKKAAQERLAAPPEVLEYIASARSRRNIRELEGALIRVTAFASLNRQPVDLALAEIVLKDLHPRRDRPRRSPSARSWPQTAAYFGLSLEDLCGSSRSRVLVTARQIAMYLCRELTDLSLPKIGQEFGGRDHTTVMHADRKIRTLMAERRSIYNQVTELTNRIKSQARSSDPPAPLSPAVITPCTWRNAPCVHAQPGDNRVDNRGQSCRERVGTHCGRLARPRRSSRNRPACVHGSSTAACARRHPG